MAHAGLKHLTVPVILLVAGLVKWCVGLGGHSGELFGVESGTEKEGKKDELKLTTTSSSFPFLAVTRSR